MGQTIRIINWRFYYVKHTNLVCALVSLAKKLLEKNYSMVICVNSFMYDSMNNVLWDVGLPHGTDQLPNELQLYNPIWLTSSIHENPIHSQYLLTVEQWSDHFSNIAFFNEDKDMLEHLYNQHSGLFFYENEKGRWVQRSS